MLVSAICLLAGYQLGLAQNDHRNYSERVDFLAGKTSLAATTTADFEPFWKSWLILKDHYAGPKATSTTDQDRVWAAIEGLAQAYEDPYTVFLPPAESKDFKESVKGEFSGVGMEIGLKEKILTVIAPLKNSPAEKAGILAGDKILKIDDQSTAGLSAEEAVQKIRGERGTEVKLSLFRESAGNKPFELKIIRDLITIPNIETKLREDGIFIIRVFSFSEQTPRLFRDALEEFVRESNKNPKVDSLIIDLRNNPGGYLEVAVDMASWFLPKDKVIAIEDYKKEGRRKEYLSRGYNIFTDRLKLVILVNGGSASASEILAGALKEHGKATLIGEKTFGKGSVQELFQITDETSLKVTIAKWLTPKGLSISEGGLTPDIIVEYEKPKEKEGTKDKKEEEGEYDSQEKRAVKFLKEGK